MYKMYNKIIKYLLKKVFLNISSNFHSIIKMESYY